jgi:hypothetical protein
MKYKMLNNEAVTLHKPTPEEIAKARETMKNRDERYRLASIRAQKLVDALNAKEL